MVKFLRMTLFALLFSITFGASSLAFGYHLAGFTLFVRWILFFGAAWLVAVWQRWRWFAYIGVAFNLLVAALGLWLLNFSPGWMFAGAIGGLLAFDLTFFWQRVRFIDSDVERRGLEFASSAPNQFACHPCYDVCESRNACQKAIYI